MVTKRLIDISEKTVKTALKEGADQAQVASFLLDDTLTRFANSQIHQNIASKTGGIAIKVVMNKKIGTLRVNTLGEKQIEDAVKKVVKIAKVTPHNKDFRSLPEPQKWTPLKGAFDSETALCTPDYRAEKVKEIIETAHSKSSIVKAVAGSFSTGSVAFGISNSLGVSAWAQMSLASINTTVISEVEGSEGFGSAEQYSRFVEDIDHIQVASEAAEKSVKSVKPMKISPGDYEVILSPRAVAVLLSYLGYIGFSATMYQDGQSFVKYHLEKQVFDEKLSVKDDARDSLSLYAVPVDGEGVPKKAVQLIDKGIVSERSICYDSFTAGKEKNKKSTGHSIPPVVRFYPYPRPLPINVIASPGDASIDEMIADTKRGIFVTRFHYTNPLEPTKAILTGLTRDGTFLIENGEISKPVVNLRYTDSMLSALKDIPMIGEKLVQVDDTTAPAMKLKKLRFTGVTEY
ncbi:MAG: TldD/PmbA family protein [Candidatus Bathyarchaeota archaeon]|nr:TldD/PmbA family protein [Candidatus Bathyarchaeota archaeon]MDH5733259.1 TldD/PmbA family protein [Candidatus Bathyarchaeota archaeon]